MARVKMLRIRVTEKEHEKLEHVAQSQQISLSEVVRDFIKGLPEPGTKEAKR